MIEYSKEYDKAIYLFLMIKKVVGVMKKGNFQRIWKKNFLFILVITLFIVIQKSFMLVLENIATFKKVLTRI